MSIHLTHIHVYPVKGLGGLTLAHSEVTRRGLRFDRRFLVVDNNDHFLSQRELPKMATVWMDIDAAKGEVHFAAPDIEPLVLPLEPPESPSRMVKIWRSDVLAHEISAEANAWMSEFLGFDSRLVYMPESSERRISADYAKNDEIVSFADGYPLLIATEESLEDLNARMTAIGSPALPMNRFRPNLVIRGGGAFFEDRINEVRVGEAIFRATKPCIRCQVTTTDQASGEVRGPEPLRTLSTYRDTPDGPKFGVNLVPVKLGTVRVGDEVELV